MAGTLLVSNVNIPQDMKTEEVISDTKDIYYVDGVQVTWQLYKFCMALKKQYAFMGCLFGKVSGYDNGPCESLWVYSPDEIFARGQVGYGDVGIEAILYKYFVETEQIRNYKVKTSRRSHNMTSSDSIDRMVKAAKRHLRRYATSKIVDLTAYKLTTSLSNEKDKSRDAEEAAMTTMQSMLTRSGALTAELANMVKVNYEFKDGSVRDAIVTYMDTIGNDIEVASRNVSITLVLVHPPHGASSQHSVSVQRGLKHLNLNKRVYVTDVEAAFEDSPVERYSPENLPEEIRQKISSLNILDVDSYVDGLGLRQSENIYYLAEDA